MSSPALTFQDGNFYFENKAIDFQAAIEVRRFANETTERILGNVLNREYDVPVLPPLPFLDSHQVRGVNWILTRKRSYLAHAPGAGKTAQAIVASVFAKGKGQTVFIVPPSLVANWEREIIKFSEYLPIFPTISSVPLSAKKLDMDWGADFILVPDSMLVKPWVYEKLLAMKRKFVAVDEASRFKEVTSERTKALFGGVGRSYNYMGLLMGVRHFTLLDGSPMPNRPMELWAPTYACDPEAIDCKEETDFGLRYCGATTNEYGNEAELSRKLRQRFMHVVLEHDLSHPERRRSLVYMNQDVRTPEHKTWERKHLNHLKFSDLDEESSRGDLARFRAELGRRKVSWVGRYVDERLKTKNESILLFAWHRDVCQMLAGYLQNHKPGLVIGGTKNDDRERIFANFQSGKQRLIIGNIAAMGRGHNLQRADRVIFAEPSWTDELNKQCEKRASRRGRAQASFVRCEYVVAPDSMDEPILNSLFTKEARVRKVIG
jgi:SWI/SNF-related matrix-associated actin-dependent regulator 1 of chromatin subfamily A